ncbi:hypothetical protein SPHINGOR109_10205 [Sphingorhabdus sp. 109]|nr:hypothetical protein SPHINGOR109_10205 [Sphingorhabdus sp. 109]
MRVHLLKCLRVRKANTDEHGRNHAAFLDDAAMSGGESGSAAGLIRDSKSRIGWREHRYRTECPLSCRGRRPSIGRALAPTG